MAVNVFGFMVQQATIDPEPEPPPCATREQAELVADIARRLGGCTYGGLVMGSGLSRPTMERYTRAAVAAGLVRVVPRGKRGHRWIEAIE